MVIIKDKSKNNRIYIPKHYLPKHDDYVLNLLGLTDNQMYSTNVIDEYNMYDFYCFGVNVRELPDQEYKYTVIDNDCVISTGLMRIGKVNYTENKYFEQPSTIEIQEEINEIKYYE